MSPRFSVWCSTSPRYAVWCYRVAAWCSRCAARCSRCAAWWSMSPRCAVWWYVFLRVAGMCCVFIRVAGMCCVRFAAHRHYEGIDLVDQQAGHALDSVSDVWTWFPSLVGNARALGQLWSDNSQSAAFQNVLQASYLILTGLSFCVPPVAVLPTALANFSWDEALLFHSLLLLVFSTWIISSTRYRPGSLYSLLTTVPSHELLTSHFRVCLRSYFK